MNKADLYNKVIASWGVSNQINQLVEEMAELIVAINKYRRTGSEQWLEEIADVEIMIEQIKIIIGEKGKRIISEHKKRKLKRLENRLTAYNSKKYIHPKL